MTKLVFTDPPITLLPKTVEAIKRLPGLEVVVYDSFAADEAELFERGKTADIIVTDITKYPAALLSRWPRLRAVVTASVGTDHIDVAYCAKHGVKVVNFPGYNARAVAEMAFAILVSLLRKVPMAQQYARSGGWDFQYFEGQELAGKMLGLVGVGHVGRELLRIGQGFDMRVMAHTAHPSAERAEQLGLDRFYELPEVLKAADVLVLAVPATADTAGLLGAPELARLKPQAVLVNVGRGVLVDTMALAEALYQRRLAGAALDVIENEPFAGAQAHPLIQEMVNSTNVVLTPHIAFNTRETAERLGERMVAEVRALLTD